MTNSGSIKKDVILACVRILTDGGLNRMKFITLKTVPPVHSRPVCVCILIYCKIHDHCEEVASFSCVFYI